MHLIVWRLEPEVVSGVVARQQDQVNILQADLCFFKENSRSKTSYCKR